MKCRLEIFILVLIVIITGGCSKDIKCKNTYDDNIKYKVVIEADISEGNVTNAEAVMKFENELDAASMCHLNKFLVNDRVKVSCEKKKVIIMGYENLEYGVGENNITKDKFIENLEKQGFSC